MDLRQDAGEVAAALRIGISLLVRRLRHVQPDGGISVPEATALALLHRDGPATCTTLAKREQITPQSMGATLASLEARGLIQRRTDPEDGRRAVMSITRAGNEIISRRRDATTDTIARSLAAHFTAGELEALRTAAALI